VLYVGTQLAPSLMVQAPTTDQTQRRILLLLPLFFAIFIISFPAGLILYWITTNTWTMAFALVANERTRWGRSKSALLMSWEISPLAYWR
jgi:YidC/Oxa1 family membrane protein insertase